MFDTKVPFRGSIAVRDGLQTRAQLRRHFKSVYPDVYLFRDAEPDLIMRSRAALVLCRGRGVLAGYSAAALLGADCAPPPARPEVIVPGGTWPRTCPELLVRYDLLAPDEVTSRDGLPATSPLRTAYDLARRVPLRPAIVALDALARMGRFPSPAVLELAERYPRARGRRRLPRVVELSDPLAESVMESRTRLALVLGGLPAPRSQVEVRDGWFVARLDLAYEDARVGIEYDGAHHLDRTAFAADLARHNRLMALGWTVLRVTANDVLHYPDRLVSQVQAALSRRRRSA